MDIKTLKRFDNHSHSMFSNFNLIDSINRPKDMILKAHELGMSGIALTDHETVAGHVEWLKCEKDLKASGKIPQDFKCACGNEIYLVDDRANIERYWHYILIAKNTEGHRALRELSSTAWYNGFSSRGLYRVPTEKKELEEIVRRYPNTLIATTACFVKGALVLTRDGKKKIEDITDQDYILNRYGEWEKVNFPTCRDYVGEGKEIYFLENPTPTVCTSNHQFLVTTNNKIQYYKKTGKNPLEWVEAKDLNVFKGGTKHICVFPVNNFNYSNKDILYKEENHDNKKFIEIAGVLYKKVFLKEIKTIQLNEKVYCLNVNSHSFCCNDVVVHNCLGGELPHFVAELVKAEKKGDEFDVYDWKMKIDNFIRWNLNLFGEDFYIEIAAASSKDQIKFNKRVVSIAAAYNIKIVIGSDAHYLTSKERPVHKAYLNSKDGEREVDDFYTYSHMMDNIEAFEYLKDSDFTEEDFKNFCDNSMEIYNKIGTYDIFRKPIIPRVNVVPKDCPVTPDWIWKDKCPVLTELIQSDNVQEKYWVTECLLSMIDKGLFGKENYMIALETEARVIKVVGEKLGNCLYEYFNTFQHMINLFWEQGSIVGPGRGSAVCFLSNYLLGITQLDPLQWGLKNWRFLNEERVELPKLYIGQYKIGERIQRCLLN